MIEKEWAQLDQIADEGTVEKIIGRIGVKSVKRQLLGRFMAQVRYIFVDLPDYTKNDIRAMNKDIDELQHMWMKFAQTPGNKTSFVIAIQKEIAMKRPHSFLVNLAL